MGVIYRFARYPISATAALLHRDVDEGDRLGWVTGHRCSLTIAGTEGHRLVCPRLSTSHWVSKPVPTDWHAARSMLAAGFQIVGWLAYMLILGGAGHEDRVVHALPPVPGGVVRPPAHSG